MRMPIALLLALAPIAAAEAAKSYLSSPRRAYTAPELKDAPDEWIARSFAWVTDMLAEFPPAVPEHPARRAALIRLDDILHIESAPAKPLVQEFFRQHTAKAAAEIEKTKVAEGARIWKIYNQTWIVRTPGVTLAFDVVPGTRATGFQMTPETLATLVRQSDILFISHEHSDHANKDVARMFLDQGKQVVAAAGLWSNDPEFAGRLTYPRRSATEVHPIEVRPGGPKLEVVAYPGHQGKSPIVNVHLVRTPEKLTVVHTGDQSLDETDIHNDFDWIMRVGSQHGVDVLLPNCWTTDIRRMLRGINPKLVLTGHENEMDHTVDHREDYTQTYNHLFGSPYPVSVMSWGESFWYRP
jgi:L-ascorbate metabolism protein UlaG (beta-lactamase superfamily)